jgi:hypothetical protein
VKADRPLRARDVTGAGKAEDLDWLFEAADEAEVSVR